MSDEQKPKRIINVKASSAYFAFYDPATGEMKDVAQLSDASYNFEPIPVPDETREPIKCELPSVTFVFKPMSKREYRALMRAFFPSWLERLWSALLERYASKN